MKGNAAAGFFSSAHKVCIWLAISRRRSSDADRYSRSSSATFVLKSDPNMDRTITPLPQYSRRMALDRLLLSMILLLVGAAAHADVVPRATKKIDAYLDGLQGQLNGSIAISERGVVRYKRSLGFATLENGTENPADAGTRYRIGAVTRIFTAAL